MRIKRIVAPSLLVVLAGVLLVQLPVAIAERSDDYEWIDPVLDVHHIIQSDFADEGKIDGAKIRLAMIDAMIETLDDPHTVYVPPSDIAEFNKDLRGTYVGIGCEVNTQDDYLVIVSPMDGSPALEAGIMAGDIVLEIEGESTLKMPVEQSIKRLTGAPGTPVTIKVRHLDGKEQTYTIIRKQITTRTVKGLRREGDRWNYCIDDSLGLAYVHVTQFNETTTEEFKAALDQILPKGLNGLVLDLRDNPGGGLTTAVQMADLFLEQGEIVTIKPRAGRGESKTFSAQRLGTLPDFPIIVLVNGFSASASEILSGALQANGRAKVLGTRTFGKGSVQEVRDLDYNRGTLKFTTAHYYLKGLDGQERNINRSSDSTVWGVDPDPGMVVPMSDVDYVESIRARREYEIIKASNGDQPACVDGTWVRGTMKDEQLALAIEALRTRLKAGEWPTVGESNAGAVAFDLELKRAVENREILVKQLNKIEDRLDELHHLAADVGRAPLLPPDIDLLQGSLTIRDKQGNVVGTYRIEGGDLESALETVKLEPVAKE